MGTNATLARLNLRNGNPDRVRRVEGRSLAPQNCQGLHVHDLGVQFFLGIGVRLQYLTIFSFCLR